VLPSSEKYIQWATEIDLSEPSTTLAGPFNFEEITSTNRTRNKVQQAYWLQLHDTCNELALLPPTTGSANKHSPQEKESKKKKRKRK